MESDTKGSQGRKPFFAKCVFIGARVEERTKRLLIRLGADPRMIAKTGTGWHGGVPSYGRIISVLAEEEAARLGIGVEGALLSDEQLDKSKE